MNARYLALAGRIAQELDEQERLVQRIQRLWEQAERSHDEAYIDATALNLHGFYAGIERIFEWIATDVDTILSTEEIASFVRFLEDAGPS
ncbi:MAG TPA: hypothetical protein ENK60_04510 [Anaerolineae bacterium]|nr:hypothetical protein [Anaerolineae bacterium]